MDTEVSALFAARSYKPQVLVGGTWSDNALRFATEIEAKRWADALLMRWFVPTDARAAMSSDAVNSRLSEDGTIESISEPHLITSERAA